MGSMILPTVLTQQPQQVSGINWGNPIARGLVFAYVFGAEAVGYGETGNNQFSYVTSGGVALGSEIYTGVGTAIKSSGSTAATLNTSQTSVTTGSYSLFAVGTGPSTGMQSALDDDDGSTRRFQFRLNAGKVEFIPFNSSNAVVVDVVAPTALTSSQLANGFTMGATASSTAATIYQNRNKTTSAASGIAAPNASISIAARKTKVQFWSTGGLSLVTMWNRTLTDAEMYSLADNPWQLFTASPRRLWVFTSGTTTNVNPGAGTLALTGYAPTIAQSANQSVAPGAGTLTFTGYAPSVTQSVTTNVAPQAGTLTLTGFAPAIAQTANVSIAPSAGALTLTGYAPTVTRTANHEVQPGTGGLTLTGYAPLITQATDNAPRVSVATIMRITTTNRVANLGDVENVVAPIRSTGPNLATILSADAVNCTADLGPASINRTVSFP